MQPMIRLLVLLFIVLFSHTIFAEENKTNNPLTIIQTASGKMIEQLISKKQAIADDPAVVMSIVEELLMPHFATNTISRKVLGKHWKKISPEQKKQFSIAFRFYMVRYYSKIFASYTDQTFKYLPLPDISGKKKVTVKTRLIQTGGQPVAIDYRMQRSGDSWKIIDLKIEGISMVISNRTQFGNQISRDGIDTVIAKLEYKNKKAQANE